MSSVDYKNKGREAMGLLVLWSRKHNLELSRLMPVLNRAYLEHLTSVCVVAQAFGEPEGVSTLMTATAYLKAVGKHSTAKGSGSAFSHIVKCKSIELGLPWEAGASPRAGAASVPNKYMVEALRLALDEVMEKEKRAGDAPPQAKPPPSSVTYNSNAGEAIAAASEDEVAAIDAFFS